MHQGMKWHCTDKHSHKTKLAVTRDIYIHTNTKTQTRTHTATPTDASLSASWSKASRSWPPTVHCLTFRTTRSWTLPWSPCYHANLFFPKLQNVFWESALDFEELLGKVLCFHAGFSFCTLCIITTITICFRSTVNTCFINIIVIIINSLDMADITFVVLECVECGTPNTCSNSSRTERSSHTLNSSIHIWLPYTDQSTSTQHNTITHTHMHRQHRQNTFTQYCFSWCSFVVFTSVVLYVLWAWFMFYVFTCFRNR